MNTTLFEINEKSIKEAARIIAVGGLVAFPTETVYGLGADAFDPNAAKKAYAAKGRPSDNPLIVHISKFEDLYRLTDIFDSGNSKLVSRVQKLAEAFWPGPLTIVLPKKDNVPEETTGGLNTVAVRMPKNDATLKLIEYSGTLVSGPYANLSGHPSPTSWLHVKNDLDGKIDGIIKDADCEVGIESTVIDAKTLTIYRPGFITPEMIAAVTGEEVSYDKALFSKPSEDPNYHPLAPGQKYKHYAPNAEMHIVPLEKLKQRALEEKAKGKKVEVIEKPDAKTFFSLLRKFDDEKVDIILAGALPEGDSLNFSIMNRVLKSAGYQIEE